MLQEKKPLFTAAIASEAKKRGGEDDDDDDDDHHNHFVWRQLQNKSVDLRGGHEVNNHQISDEQFGKRWESAGGGGWHEENDERDVREDENCPVTWFSRSPQASTKNRRNGQFRG